MFIPNVTKEKLKENSANANKSISKYYMVVLMYFTPSQSDEYICESSRYMFHLPCEKGT